MHRTYSPKAGDIQRQWWLLDASGQPIGRLAATAARLLQGKHKPIYAPHMDVGDHVIILNIEKAVLTGKKQLEPVYWHSMYPGGLKSAMRGQLLKEKPEYLLRRVISGMLPKNRLRARMMRRVRLYRGGDHPHVAQQPQPFPFEGRRN